MSAVTKERKQRDWKIWEIALVALATFVSLSAAGLLVGGFSVRQFFWPRPGEGVLAKPIGRVEQVVNRALRQGYYESEFVPVSEKDSVYPADTLMVGPASAMKVVLLDGTVIELDENSMIRLNFDSMLQFAGLNRTTVLEVMSGTVAAKASAQAGVTIKSQGKVFEAKAGDVGGVMLSQKGGKIISQSVKDSLVERVRARNAFAPAEDMLARQKTLAAKQQEKTLQELRDYYGKLGATVVENTGGGEKSVAEVLREKNKPVAAPIGGGNTGAKEPEWLKHTRAKYIETSAKIAFSGGQVYKIKYGALSVSDVTPEDNIHYELKNGSLPLTFHWKVNPEDANTRFRLSGHIPDASVMVPSSGDEASFQYVFKKPGTYVWSLEDKTGSMLLVRRFHVNAPVKHIAVSGPMLAEQDMAMRMSVAMRDLWSLLFIWEEVPGAASYKIRVVRNIEAPQTVEERVVKSPSVILSFPKNYMVERMFLTVETEKGGVKYISNVLTFAFPYFPPRLNFPSDKGEVGRADMVEGAVVLKWVGDAELQVFFVEVATDIFFRNVVASQKVLGHAYRFYPEEPGKYYWRVRGYRRDDSIIPALWTYPFEFMMK